MRLRWFIVATLLSTGCGQAIYPYDAGDPGDAGDAGDAGDGGGQDAGDAGDGGDAGGQDGGDAGETDAGPALLSISPDFGYAAEGVTGNTWSGELRVQLAWADDADVPVFVASSNPAVLSIEDGGLIVVPAGVAEAAIPVSGHAQASAVMITATRYDVTVDASVRVLGASEQPQLISLEPDAGEYHLSEMVQFSFELDFPPPTATTVTLALTPATMGTLTPATVTVPAFKSDGGFFFTAAARPTVDGGISASVTNTLTARARVLGPVISELAAEILSSGSGGTNAQQADEFVELYNPMSIPFDLTGCRIDYKPSSSGSAWINLHVFSSTSGPVMPPHSYYLVGSADFGGTPDARYSQSGTTMSANGGSVRLIKSSAPVYDQLSWGTGLGLAPEGNEVFPEAHDGQSIERKANELSDNVTMSTGGSDALSGNAYDTDDNARDFVIRGTRDPQRSTSPTEP